MTFQISIANEQKELIREVAKSDPIYWSDRYNQPAYKKYFEDASKVFHAIKTSRMRIIIIALCRNCKKNSELESIINLLEGK